MACAFSENRACISNVSVTLASLVLGLLSRADSNVPCLSSEQVRLVDKMPGGNGGL